MRVRAEEGKMIEKIPGMVNDSEEMPCWVLGGSIKGKGERG